MTLERVLLVLAVWVVLAMFVGLYVGQIFRCDK